MTSIVSCRRQAGHRYSVGPSSCSFGRGMISSPQNGHRTVAIYVSLSEEHFCKAVEILGNLLQFRDGFVQRHVDDVSASERGHPPPLSFRRKIDGRNAVSGSQDPVVGCGCASSLYVTEDGDSRLEPGPFLDLAGDHIRDSAETFAAELVALVPRNVERSCDRQRSFGYDDDREEVSGGVAMLEVVADLR